MEAHIGNGMLPCHVGLKDSGMSLGQANRSAQDKLVMTISCLPQLRQLEGHALLL